MRKGLETQVLVMTIITIVSLLILAFALGKITGIIPSTVSKETCKTSVLLRGMELKNLPVGKLASLKCQTEYKCISMGGECPTGYDKVRVYDEDGIKRELANTMYDCWWMLGEGKVDIFSASATYGWQRTCSICSVVSFDDKLQKQYPSISGLGDFMIKNDIPNRNLTYWQYITNSPYLADYKVFENDKYPTDKRYAVTFSFFKLGMIEELLTGTAACGIGAKLGAPTGAVLGSFVPLVGNGIGMAVGGIGGCIAGFYGGYTLEDSWKKLIGSESDYYSSLMFSTYEPNSFVNCTTVESIP